jgi:hypothetical protein
LIEGNIDRNEPAKKKNIGPLPTVFESEVPKGA